MSGVKRVTIAETEYDRLRAAETRLRTVQSDLPQVLADVRRQASNDLQNRLTPLERRQQEFVSSLSGLSSNVQQMERQTAERLASQQREFRDSLSRAQDDSRQELAVASTRLTDLIEDEREAREQDMDEVLAYVDEEREARLKMGSELQERISRERNERRNEMQGLQRRMSSLIEDERNIRQRQFNEVRTEINSIQQNEGRKAELAREWIRTARVVRDFIAKEYVRHEQFAPGRLARLEAAINQAIGNADNGVNEAAITQAQDSYRELSELRIELEQMEQEWLFWRATALQEARTVLATAHAARTCKAQDGEGRELDVRIEVDHWTGGRLSKLEEELGKLLQEVEAENTNLSTDQLRRIAKERTAELKREVDKVVAAARDEVIGSQKRGQIAQLVVQALQEQGYGLQEHAFVGGDYRNGFAAKVRHIDGGEVVVLVDGVAGQPGENQMRILSYDEEQHTEHEREVRAKEVAASLRRRNLQVGAVMKEADRPDPAYRRVAEMTRPATAATAATAAAPASQVQPQVQPVTTTTTRR
ncbi:MAG TPA: hypothetical protein VF826_16985 [Chloroflexia bacterium]|jgi:hypothetical protein